MKYALGNMLNGAGGLNPDGLALDLQFATDKTLTARKGPTPVLTRGSGNNGGTTYFGPSSFLVDFTYAGSFYSAIIVQQPSLGLSSNRWRWGDGSNIELKYNGTSWELLYLASIIHTSSPTTAWLPDRADWGTTGVLVYDSGDFGIVKAANDEPRFDHDPVSPFACRGLLIEEQRTNLFQYSEIFNEAASLNYWDSTSANAVTSNQTTSPDGAVTADLLTTSATAFDCFVRRAINWVGSTQYSYSIFLKRGPSNHRYVGLYIGAGITGANQYPYFDFDNPTTVQIPSGTMVGTINSTRVDAYQNGWYRVSVTFTTAATPVTPFGGVYVATSNGTLPNTSTAGLDCYIWGIQAETGAFPTSYIPTTTSTLARSADVCSITGGDFMALYNAPEGTLLVNAEEFRRGTSYTPIFRVANSANSGNNRYQIGTSGNKTSAVSPIEFITTSDGPSSYQAALNSATSNFKAVLAYSVDDMRGALNGVLATADTAPSALIIGANTLTINSVGGYISAIRYYKKRLPNAKLQALTA